MNIKFWQKKEKESPQFFSAGDSDIGQSEYTYHGPADTLETEIVHESVEEKGTIYKKISQMIVLAGVFLLPIFFLPWTASVLDLNKQVLLMVMAGLGLVFWLLHVVISGQISWRSTFLDKGVAAFLAAVALATVFSSARFNSLFGLNGNLSFSLATVIALTIIYFLIVNLFDDEQSILGTFFIRGLVLALIYGVLQLFGVYLLHFSFSVSRAFNTVGSVNSLGLLAGASLPLFWKNKAGASVIQKWVNLVGIFLAMVILIVLNWWALWIVAIVGMVALVALESMDRSSDMANDKKIKITNFLLPMTVIILGVFFMAVNINFSYVKKNLPIEVAPSFSLSAQIAKDTIAKNPAFGFGPENFSLAFDKFGAKQIANTTLFQAKFSDATSEALNFAVQGGIVGIATFLFLIFLLGKMVYRSIYKKLDSNSVGLLSAVVALSVGMFVYPFNITNAGIFYILLALGALVLSKDDKKVINVEDKASTSLISSLGFIGSLILVLIGSYFGANIYMSNLKYSQALTQKDIQKRADLLVQSINWNDQSDIYYRSASQVALSLLASELSKKNADPQRTQKVQNYITTAVNLAQRATQVVPIEADNWLNLGVVYQNLIRLVDGADKLAEDSFNKAAQLRPGDPTYYYNTGSMYLVESDLLRQLGADKYGTQIQQTLAKSENYLQKATDLSANYGLAIYSLGAVYDRENKVNEAIRQLEKLAPFNANQPNLAFELGLLYYRAGQKDKAFDQLQRAVLLAPDYANARWYLALIYEERRDLASATDQLNRILSIDVNKNNQVVLGELAKIAKGKPSVPPSKVLDQKPLQ